MSKRKPMEAWAVLIGKNDIDPMLFQTEKRAIAVVKNWDEGILVHLVEQSPATERELKTLRRVMRAAKKQVKQSPELCHGYLLRAVEAALKEKK